MMKKKWGLVIAILALGVSSSVYAAEEEPVIVSEEAVEDLAAEAESSQADDGAAEEAEPELSLEIVIESEAVAVEYVDVEDEASAIALSDDAEDMAAAVSDTLDGIVTEDGFTYYYKDGVLQTGWQTVNGNTYYFYKSAKTNSPKGAAATGLTKIGDYRYYFNSKGVMQTGKKTISGKIYYFYKSDKDEAPKGSAATGLVKISGSYYYFSSTGKAYTSKWKTITASNGKSYKYYFRSNGKAYADKVVEINGATYAFDSKGRMLTGVQVIDYQFYVFYSNGKLNTTKTNKLRKASAYESDASTLISLLEKYGAILKETNYYGSSCYGNGEDGEMVYDTFTVYIFKYASTGKIIVFSVE